MRQKGRSTTTIQFRVASYLLEAYKEKWQAKNLSVNLYAQALFMKDLGDTNVSKKGAHGLQ